MRPFRSCFRGLMRMVRGQRFRILVSVLIGLVGVAASLGFVWISKKVVDVATGDPGTPLTPSVLIMLGIMLLQLFCRVGGRYWEGLIVVKAQNALRSSAFRKVMFSTWSGKDRLHSGDTVNRLEEDIRVVVDFICVSLPDALITLIQLLGASVFIFVLSPNLAWILLLIMPVAVLCSRLFFKKLRALTGLNYNAISRGFMQLGFSAGYALVFLWGLFGLRDGTITYGTMVAFLQLVGQVQRPVAGIALQIPAFIRALSSEDRLLDLVEAPQEEEGSDIVLQGAPGVKVEGVSFTYEGVNNPVVRGLDFDFTPGSMTAIIGSTGAGKSTLVRVIMALLQPGCNFMYVPQGNSLMSGTIRENLLLAKPDADEDELREVLHLAAADFVYELQDGLETTCAEIGAGLSEGQAQRIAIARALLRPGGILVLDEATSALDADTELELLERLGARFRGTKTILCITHRPAATSYADKVLKL